MPNIIPITDFSDPNLDPIARLTEHQLLNREDPNEGKFIGETAVVIERALDAGYVPVSFFVEEKLLPEVLERFAPRCPDTPIYVSPYDVLCQLIGYNLCHGMLAVMRRPQLPSVEEICKNAKRIAVMEDVMNPTNVGAIMRSAAALNVDAVLLTVGCSNPLYRRAIRVSVGTVFQIPWTFFDKNAPYTDQLHALGFKTVAMALRDDSYAMFDPRLQQEEKLAIVLGTEGDGLKNSTIEECDFTVKIPMTHGVDSLNVAAASAVAFYQLALLGRTE